MESESVLNILSLIFAGSLLSEVLTIIVRLVESQGQGTLCTKTIRFCALGSKKASRRSPTPSAGSSAAAGLQVMKALAG